MTELGEEADCEQGGGGSSVRGPPQIFTIDGTRNVKSKRSMIVSIDWARLLRQIPWPIHILESR